MATSGKKSILFVCLGNICRSPACEGVCKFFARDDLIVESASTSSWHRNEGPDERAQEICLKHGIDITGHRSRPIRSDDWSRFDIIAALDDSCFQTLEQAKPSDAHAKVVLFNPPNGIADPYYGGRTGFQKMFDQIFKTMQNFLEDNDLLPKSNN